jgi:hypothetical protein
VEEIRPRTRFRSPSLTDSTLGTARWGRVRAGFGLQRWGQAS